MQGDMIQAYTQISSDETHHTGYMILIRPPLIVPDGMMRLSADLRKVPGQGKLSAPKNALWRSGIWLRN